MPILSPVSVAMELDEFSHSVTEFTPEMPDIRPIIAISTAQQNRFFFPLWHRHL